MKEQFQHKLTTSFFLWFDNFLLTKGEAFSNKTGESNGYSKYSYSLKAATRNGIIYPSMDPTIFEIKYPNADIKGSVTTY